MMKSFYLTVLMALMAVLASAQPKEGSVKRTDLRAVATKYQMPMRRAMAKTPSLDDIISEQPAGTLKQYLRTGMAMIGDDFDVYEFEQNGSVAKVVFGDDGKSVYFYMPLSQITYPAWVKGTLSDDGTTITVPAGQQVLYDVTEPNPWTDDPGGEIYSFRLHLLELTELDNGSYTYNIAEGDPDIVWTVDKETGALSLSSTDLDGYMIMGIVYDTPDDPEADGQWNGYADYATVYVPFTDEPLAVPDGLKTETYSMTYTNESGNVQGKLVDVAFDGDDIWITNFSKDFPDVWIKGSIVDGKVVFSRQMLLIDEFSDVVYFQAYKANEVVEEWGSYFEYEASTDDIVFNYDAATRSFATDMNCNVNASAIRFSGMEMFGQPSFSPYTEVAATPADPIITYFDGYEGDRGYICFADFTIPTVDVDGNFIDPAKLSFCFYTSENEVYHFVRDNYIRTEETDGWDFEPAWTDGMTEIPYTIVDEGYDFSKDRVYFRFGEMSRLGLQSIYRGAGVERRSNIYFYDEGIYEPTGIREMTTQTRPSEVFDLQGRRVAQPTRGLYIVDGRKMIKN